MMPHLKQLISQVRDLMPKQLKVMISSTSHDLPKHREQVREACLQQGMFPIMMEQLPASDAAAVAGSVKIVEKEGIFLLFFVARFGYFALLEKLPGNFVDV